MDTKIEQKRKPLGKYGKYILGGIVIIGLFVWGLTGLNSKTIKVNKEQLVTATVEQAKFNDYVKVEGQVQPFSSIQVSALEGGMVEEKLVEEGAMVQKGDIIVRLSNPSLNLSILDSEAQLAEKQNFLRNTQVTMEQEKLNIQKESLQVDLEIERKLRKAKQYEELYKEELCSKEEYLQAQEDYTFAKRSGELIRNRQKQDSIYRGIQVSQMEESLHNMRRNLELVRERTQQLNVKAPADGQLGLLDVEIGQMVAAGSKIGQVNVLSNHKVEAMIDEHYIDRVRADLPATCERQGQVFELRVRKVFPEVRDKTFKTEFVFVDEKPENIRTGQTYHISLELGQSSTALLIPRGAFYSDTGGQWIFVLSSDGKKAYRREVRIGRQNPEYYEVLSGLDEGEEVIVSTYRDFGNALELIIK
ncbi:efflux RND transporter periplasmic adaptor subunit [Porphyromonadaceae bacterium W3.11]|nr:efflux RND transporter periplasmic adaptor subunit [Porphyromonadaceae bacterium W3.11]